MDPSYGYHSLDLELINEKAETLEYTGGQFSFTSQFFEGVPMSPGETWYSSIALLYTNGIHDHGIYGWLFHSYLPTGTYRIRANHTGVWSTQLEFKVSNPEGTEKRAYDAMVATYLPDGQRVSPTKALVPGLEKFLADFPTSAYTEKVTYELARETGQYADLLEQFPNCGFDREAINHLSDTATDKRAFLKRVIADHPGTRSARFAEQKLRGD